MSADKLSGKPGKMPGGYLQWTSIPFRGVQILHAAETGIALTALALMTQFQVHKGVSDSSDVDVQLYRTEYDDN